MIHGTLLRGLRVAVTESRGVGGWAGGHELGPEELLISVFAEQ